MGPGVFLLVVGAILTFAVKADTSAVDLQRMGLIFLVAGAALVWHDRNGASREREVTTVEDHSDPDRPVRTVRETVAEHDPYERLEDELHDTAPDTAAAEPRMRPQG